MANVDALFMDKETEEGLGWGEIWAMFSPLTPYGLAAKNAMEPHRPGQETQLQAVLAQLRQDAEALKHRDGEDNRRTQQLEQMLRELPDIRPSLQTLAQNGVLGMKDLLALKKFVWSAWPHVHESTFTFTSVKMWTQIRELCGWDSGPSFSIESIGGDRVREALQIYSAALAKRAKVDKATSDEWMARTGYRPTREGQLIIRMPQGRAVADALKAEASQDGAPPGDARPAESFPDKPSVKWVRDTPFESVFQVVLTDEQTAAAADVERAKRELAAAEDEVLRLFSVELRNRLQTLQTMVSDIANLDVRLAKVRLLFQLGGCVPEVVCASEAECTSKVECASESECVSETADRAGGRQGPPTAVWVHGAVHPLAKRQRESHGASFHPFDWSLHATLNVLCGPNMGGKTVAMQTWCILQALTQFGLPVPAKRMQTRLFDAIRFTSSAETNVQLGLSAFGREMVRIAEVAQVVSQTKSAIVCFDEPCRSTNPMEGEALAMALAGHFRDELHGRGLCILTTHYTGVLNVPDAAVFEASGWDEALGEWLDAQSHLELLDWHERLKAAQTMEKHTLRPATDSEVHSFAIRTAELLGVPPEVIERARLHGKSAPMHRT